MSHPASADVLRCPRCATNNRIPAAARGVPRCAHCHQPLPWITTADEESFAEVVERAPLPVLVDLWATWCGPCRMLSPTLEQLATERAGRVKLVKIDVDAAPALARRFEVAAVPTLLVTRDGTVLARHAGAAALPVLRTWLDNSIGRPADESDATRTRR